MNRDGVASIYNAERRDMVEYIQSRYNCTRMDAEDIVQDAVIKLIEKPEYYEKCIADGVEKRLWAIARQLAMHQFRGNVRRALHQLEHARRALLQ